MDRLLDSVIEAHGGANRWDEFSDLVTDVELSGQIFQRMAWSDMLTQTRLLIALRSERSILLLPEGKGKVIVEPDRTTLFDGTGTQIESMADPTMRIAQLQAEFGRDTLSAAYYLINVVRRAVAAPFLYASARFVTEEVAPWNEDGKVWSVLKVTFPDGADVPSRVQYAYFGPDGLLRRLRYRVDLLGGLDLVEYVDSYSDVNGIHIPLLITVFASDPMGRKLDDRQLCSIKLRDTFLTS